MVTIGSLCSGYGGLDMGLQTVVGGEVRWHFEYDKHASQILKHHHPSIPNYGDITATDWDIEPVDWITAGYPCQPFSHAGNRKGTNDRRHIWPHIKNAIRTLQPGGVLLENVAGHLSLGFDTVLGDLVEIGYDANWLCLRAADAGAPHARKRLFIVAHPNGRARQEPRRTDRCLSAEGQGLRGRQDTGKAGEVVGSGDPTLADARSERWQKSVEREGEPRFSDDEHRSYGIYREAIERWERILGRPSPRLTDAMGRLDAPFVEWMMGLPEGWVSDVPISRSAQLTALGNGVVPQQAALALQLMGVS